MNFPTTDKKKIIINGMHGKTLRVQDYDDTSWERWGLGHHTTHWRYWDKLFESHCPEICAKWSRRHQEKLADYVSMGWPVYSPWKWPEETGIQTVTHDQVQQAFLDRGIHSRLYWQSSISFPLACAMLVPGIEEIGIYGVDMNPDGEDPDNERTNQKHSVLYQIGMAEGMGIKVTVAPNSTLFDSRWTGGVYGNPKAIDDFPYNIG